MKKILSIILAAVIMAATFGFATMAHAENAWEGVVLPNSISIREGPGTSYKKLGTAYNGQFLAIVGHVSAEASTDGQSWYVVEFQGSYAYVKEAFVAPDAYRVVCLETVALYSDPFTGMLNGERYKGDVLTVTGETDEWFIVQTNDGHSGSSFIRREDAPNLQLYVEPAPAPAQPSRPSQTDRPSDDPYEPDPSVDTTGYGDRLAVVEDVSVSVRKDIGGDIIGTLHYGDVVTVMRYKAGYAYVYFDDAAGQAVYGWVALTYMAKVN